MIFLIYSNLEHKSASSFLNFQNIIIIIKWGVELPQTKTLPKFKSSSLRPQPDISANNNWARVLTEKSLNASTPKTINNTR